MMHTLSQIRHRTAVTIGTTALLAFVAVVVAIAPLPTVKAETKRPSVERLTLAAAPAVDRSRSVAPFAPPAFVRSSAENDSPPQGGIAGDVPGTCGDVMLTQSVDPNTVLVGNTIACATGAPPVTTENGFARSFSIAPGPNFVVNCVDFGVDSNVGGDFDVEVNILTGDINGPYNSLTLLGSQVVTIPDGASGVFTADFGGSNQSISVPGGSNMIVEIHAPSRLVAGGGDGGAFFMGANDAGESAPSYIRAADCGLVDFIDTASIGFPDRHWLIRVDGGPMHYTALTICNNTGAAASDLHLNLAGAGGTAYVGPTELFAPGCPSPSIPTNNQVTNSIDIDWGTPCVPNSACVVVIVATAQGPISVVDANWTLGGVDIGPAQVQVEPLPDFKKPSKPYRKIRFETTYDRPRVAGPWTYPGAGRCWVRIRCWVPFEICFYRIVITRYPSPVHRMWGVGGNLAYRSPWIPYAVRKLPADEYEKEFATMRPQGPIQKGPPKKPEIPPIGSPEFWEWLKKHTGIELMTSDDDGLNWQEGTDFAATFLNVAEALRVVVEEPLPDLPEPFPVMVARFGDRYPVAAEQLSGLIAEFVAIADAGDPGAPVVLEALLGIQEGLVGVGAELSSGNPTNPLPFDQLASALAALADALTSLPPTAGHQRFTNAAEYLLAMAEGVELAGEMVAIGMPDTDAMDAFLWGMLNRFQLLVGSFANSMLPHTRLVVDLGLGLEGWERNWLEAVWVATTDSETGEIVHERNELMNEFGHIIVTGSLGDESASETHWIKPRSHLASEVDVPLVDGHITAPILTLPGDINDDNCIDDQDLQLVLDHQGEGGFFAGEVPAADADFDGAVDEEDIPVVKDAIGVCGVPYPGETKPDPCPADLTGDGNVGVPDLLQLLSCWGPIAPGCEAADLTGSGNVGVPDLLELLAQWGPCE